jgi:hypothetical protein
MVVSMQGSSSRSSEFAVALDELSSGFTVNLAMVPSRYLPLRVAECVLFVGRAVRLLTQQRFDVTAPRAPPAVPLSGGHVRSALSSGESASPGIAPSVSFHRGDGLGGCLMCLCLCLCVFVC